MVDEHGTHDNKPGILNRLYHFVFQRSTWWFLGFAAWVTFFTWLIIRWSHAFKDPTDRYAFIAQQMFNGLVFTAVVIQALIYGGQLRVMGVSFKPRLRITNVRVENLEAGKEPVFIVWIKNEGATTAENVRLHLRVSVGHPHPKQSALAKKTPENIVTIHAGQEESYFVPWESLITEEHMKEFNRKRSPLTISGYFKLGRIPRKEFSYRYYPWEGNRPQGVPQFIPSDFDTRLTTIVTTEAARLELEPHTPDVVTTDQTLNGTGGEALSPMQDDISIENASAPQQKENNKIEGEQPGSDPN